MERKKIESEELSGKVVVDLMCKFFNILIYLKNIFKQFDVKIIFKNIN